MAGAAALAGCGSAGGLFSAPGKGPATNGSVTVTMSDPSTCGAPNGGMFTHIWISVADVEASPNASARAGDSSFVDLTPKLRTAPMQVDLAADATQCQLPTLATNTSVAAGQFAQLRLLLASDGQAAQIAGNHCGGAANCVQLASNGSIQPIQVSAESTSGLPMSAATLLGGPVTVTAGQTQNVNIAFDACASLLVANNKFTLNPVVTGGALPLKDQISGTLQDALTHSAIGGRQIVALEQSSSGGADRVVLETAAVTSTGVFQFCAVPAGQYDLVATASNATGGQYAPTFLAAVPNGAQIGALAVFPGAGLNANPGTVQLTINSGTAPIAARIEAQERISIGTERFVATIPIPQEPAATFTALTAAGAGCVAGGACAQPLFPMPALNASSGRFQSTPNPLISSNTTTPAIYEFDVLAFAPGSGGTPSCTPSEIVSGDVPVSPNGATSPPALTFSGCG